MCIKKRLESNQITIGILVFKRIAITPKIKESQIIGTKCWFLNLLVINLKIPQKYLFFDDGNDHIQLVKIFGCKSIKPYLVITKNKQKLLKLINDLIN